MNILAIDDEKNILEGIRKRIERSGLEPVQVYLASNAIEAEEILHKEMIDLVFVDINLPFMNGLQLIEKYKEESLLFVIISGYDKFEYARKAVEYGVFRYLLKPIDKEEFEQVLFDAAHKLQQNLISVNSNDNLNTIIDVMHSHFSDPSFSLEQCSELVGLGKRQISKLLNTELNKSFTDCLNTMRIDHAVRLLNQDKKLLMSEIAESCGFVNQQYFSLIFRKIRNMSPTAYVNTRKKACDFMSQTFSVLSSFFFQPLLVSDIDSQGTQWGSDQDRQYSSTQNDFTTG